VRGGERGEGWICKGKKKIKKKEKKEEKGKKKRKKGEGGRRGICPSSRSVGRTDPGTNNQINFPSDPHHSIFFFSSSLLPYS
jgi:hypothetical protein